MRPTDQDRHGGNIYNRQIRYDFSSNINPLGIPAFALKKLQDEAVRCERYPDPEYRELKTSIARMEQVPQEWVICGNGASELIYALPRALAMRKERPVRALIPQPSFSEYERAVQAAGGHAAAFLLKKENGFRITEDILDELTPDTDLLCLCNPANPIGNRLDEALLAKILRQCREAQIVVLLDECFLPFCEDYESASGKRVIKEYPQLFVLNAFTKIYAMPGIRLGYGMCSDTMLLAGLREQIPEWSVSQSAQTAGTSIAGYRVREPRWDYMRRTRELIREQREEMAGKLRELGMQVFPPTADFICFYSRIPLFEELEKAGILIRTCGNYRGLTSGYYRTAVRNPEENRALIREIDRIVKTVGKDRSLEPGQEGENCG
ncbi:pyridoxal phosphate-dependent aminotransferase [Diplocloster agilis]|uniref:Aminotransferase class I/II-fold pyridoxal phosphate-dependent enzyme n=1 Tax=Diplocloster agilis TaxID=2850323 RepID=A0A949K5X4_9FIRM|nr:histidinol-phosphate transaminase [Diplocloster agilis]MBU9736498.1 aminotransferase class I/II-fold pyridoxal phosphate-dependent enzyme [Diplocloster agilis]